MIEVKVKSIWQGKIAIREKYYWLAKTKKEDILIQVGSDIMIIPFAELDSRIVAKSVKPVQDKFSNTNEVHYLLYYDWKPTEIQEKLLQ